MSGAGILSAWRNGARGGPTWIEYDDYAGRVFAGAPADWLVQSVRFANTLAQARKVVCTDVLTIDFTAPALAAAPGDETSPLGRSLAAVSNATPAGFVSEVVDVLAHSLGSAADLVLKLRAPIDLLRHFGETSDPGFGDLDDVSTALAAVIRALADKPMAGLLLERVAPGPLSDDEVDAYEPIFSAAGHYGWLCAMTVDVPTVSGTQVPGVDLLLCAALTPEALTGANAVGRRVGGALGHAFWQEDASQFPDPSDLAYGVIPHDASPERVVVKCEALRAR